ncbi:MAG: hypothetical protein ABSD59_21765 [Terracidiphilus sp.]
MQQPKLIPIDSYRRTAVSSGTAGPSSSYSFSIDVEEQNVAQRLGSNILSPAELYPNLEAEDGRVIQALYLLKQCCEFLGCAIQIDPRSDFISYDERMMRVRQLLRRLYALREIGDGFGATINAVIWGLRRKESEALTTRQLSTVVEVLSQLRKRPILHFDSAMALLDQLEDAELDVDPPFIELLTEFDHE